MRILTVALLLLTFSVLSASQGLEPAVIPVDAEELQALIQQEKGSVLVVNVWATWCLPCVEEFPDMLRLRNDYSTKGLAVYFVSLDPPKSADTRVRPFLRRMGVDFPTHLKRQGGDEGFINALSEEWSGALPATFIYDRNGTLLHFLLGEQTYDEMKALIAPLLIPRE